MSQLFSSKVTLVGLGSQGTAWALNLKESGFDVSVWLRKGSQAHESVQKLELKLATEFSSIILLLIPDHQHQNFLEQHYEEIPTGAAVIYAHGASCTQHEWNKLYPKLNHLLLAPKAIASEVRFQFEVDGSLGACYSTEFARAEDQEACEVLVKNLAKGIGITAGPFPTTFSHEARADLFSEQSLLCGLLPYAAKKSFDLLRSKGISEEVAYMECWLEVKLIANAMIDFGPSGFFDLISPHALIGGHKASQLFFDKAYQNILEKLYNDIERGEFFKEADSRDLTQLKQEIQNFWQSSELQSVHDRLKQDLT